MERNRASALAAGVALVAVLSACAALLIYQQRTLDVGNRRLLQLARLGTEVTTAANATPAPNGTSLLLGGVQPGVSGAGATWRSHPYWTYELSRLLGGNATCAPFAYVIASDPVALRRRATLTVSLNGEVLRTYSVGAPMRGAQPYSHAMLQPVFLAPLDQPLGLVIPVARRFCDAPTWRIGVAVEQATIGVDRVGFGARYVPPRPTNDAQAAPAAALAAATVLALFAGFFLLALRVARSFGGGAVAALTAIVVAALLTHDQWDFPIWLRFEDLYAFGHGNPARMWAGLPLWPYIVAAFAPVLRTAYALLGNGSQEVTALALKLAMGIAFGWTAYVVSRIAPAQLRKATFFIVLLSPIGLYALAGGYREIAAGLLCAIGLYLATQRRYTLAVVALTAGASVSEALLPLVLLPAALTFAQYAHGAQRRLLAYAWALAALPFGLLALEYATLPRETAGATVALRGAPTRYGGASWHSVLDAYGLMPGWVHEHLLFANLIAFAVLAVPLGVAYVVAVRRPSVDVARVYTIFFGLECAFFLSYVGIDLSTWYVLSIVAFFTIAYADVRNPYAILLSGVCGLAFYCVVGLSDFLNWTYLWPVDAGIFGLLGQPMIVLVAVTNLLILLGWAGALLGRFDWMFGLQSRAFVTLFALAMLATTTDFYAADLAFLAAVAYLYGGLLFRYLWFFEHRRPLGHTRSFGLRRSRVALRRADVAPALLLWVVAIFCARNPILIMTIAGVAAAALALTAEVTSVDVLLTVAALWMLLAHSGTGFPAALGVAGLCAFAVYAVLRALGRFKEPPQTATTLG